MADKVKIGRGAALAVLNFVGFKSGGKWDNDRLGKKLSSIKDVLPEGKKPEDEPTAKALVDVMAGIEAGSEFEVFADGAAEPKVEETPEAKAEREKKEAEAKAAKEKEKADKKAAAEKKAADEKAARELAKANKPKGVRPSRTNSYYCGVIFKKHGLKGGVTPAMVTEYDELRGRKNPEEAAAALAWAWHVVNGMTGEFAVPEATVATNGQAEAPKTEEKKEEAAPAAATA